MLVNTTLRLAKLREKLIEKKLNAFLISSFSNRFYLTGWLGDSESGYLLITPKKAFLITDSRYTEEAVQQSVGLELREYGLDEQFWPRLFQEALVERVGFEAGDLSVLSLQKLKKAASSVKFVPYENVVEKLRAQKDDQEIQLIKKAIAIADKSFEFVLNNIRVGMTEKEIAWEMEKFMRESGASKNAWEAFIVASGPSSSMVHYAAGDRKIKSGDQVLLDWGCYYQGYCCDISRVIFLGQPSSKQAKVYNLVLEAQKKAIEKIKINYKTKLVDLAAREFLQTQTKFTFGHAVGHGVGIDVHELPRINNKTKDKFQKNNIVTVEPGIYEPGWGGVRLEDMILVQEESAVLTKSPKKIEEIAIR